MSKLDIVRAWKDEEYCESLNDTQRTLLPQNPAGVVELTDQEMLQAEGGTTFSITFGCDSLAFCPPTIIIGCTITISPEIEQV